MLAENDTFHQGYNVATHCLEVPRRQSERAPNARLLTDLKGVVEVVNAAASGLLGASEGSLSGRQLAGFLPEQEREAFRSCLAKLRLTAPAGADRMEIL